MNKYALLLMLGSLSIITEPGYSTESLPASGPTSATQDDAAWVAGLTKKAADTTANLTKEGSDDVTAEVEKASESVVEKTEAITGIFLPKTQRPQPQPTKIPLSTTKAPPSHWSINVANIVNQYFGKPYKDVSYPDALSCQDGSQVYRPNHSLAHGMRQAYLAVDVVKLFYI